MQTDYSLGLTIKDGPSTALAATATGSEPNRSNELSISVIEVPTATTDMVVPLGEVTPAKDVLLESDQELSVKINTSTVAIPFKALALVGTNITALTVSNVSGNLAKLKVTLKG
jgi:hypothetical protein